MGNRGKGAKGKSSKRGKGKKGGSKPSTKWGDEQMADQGHDEDGGQPIRKKRRTTQEAQDRQRRIHLMELTRAKEQQKRERLSQPNHMPIAPLQATAPKSRRRKRKRPLKTVGKSSREARYYSSSDEENQSSGIDGGLETYKKLLTALERGTANTKGGLLPGDDDVRGDRDLLAAVRARRMQNEGLDDYESEDEVESGEEDEVAGDASEEELAASERPHKEPDTDERPKREMKGTEKLANGEAAALLRNENGSAVGVDGEQPEPTEQNEEADIRAVAENDELGVDENEGHAGTAANGSGASKDEFNRHFVATPVFPPEEATKMLSTAERPAFKPFTKTSGLREWKAAGLAISTSKRVADVPPGLDSHSGVSKELGVLPSLTAGWDVSNVGVSPPSAKLQSLLLPPIVGYKDMLYCGWRDQDAAAIRRAYALHALNHALTSQRRVLRHTVKLRKAAEEVRMAERLAHENGKGSTADVPRLPEKISIATVSNGSVEKRHQNGNNVAGVSNGKVMIETESDEWQRDQGFTRPKVLILLPFRALAHELVEIMIGILGPKTVVINKDRFDEEYGPDDSGTDDLGLDEDPDGAKAERARAVIERKPSDWKALLGEGRNVDDMFTIGLSISPGGGKGKPGEGKGVGVRLYCDFFNSDIIIASPVAMHRASVPTAGEESNEDVDSDFLSSVEVCILDRADVFLMQNWAYVPEIAEVLNMRPSGERAARADFSRVRHPFLHNQGRLFRQTLVFSAIQDPNVNALVSRQCRNHDGVVKIWRPSGEGHICQVALQAKQVFQRIPSDSPASQDDARFDYFVGTVLPQILRAKQAHTAIFIPSYFDYVRVRNYLLKSKASIASVHEYSRGSEVARSRARFFRGDRDLLLYTGRAHFFNRYNVRGIHHLVFYSLPEYPQFYPEMVNLLEEAESVAAVTCLSLFTRFERLSLERIVGEERADHMLRSAKNTFLFC